MIQLGIDLGTTNTALAIGTEVVRLSSDGHDATLLPSVVAFPPSGATLTGASARRRRVIDPKNTVFSAKRLIGQGRTSAGTSEFVRRYPTFDLAETADGALGFKTRAGIFSPIDIGAILLETGLRDVQHDVGQLAAAVTVPTRFGEQQREATTAAVRQAGISTVHVVDEPYATARAYGSRGGLGIAAVYDLGGGTFDFAVIDCRKTPYEVVASDGDPFLGGDDIDRHLATWAAAEVLERERIDLRSSPIIFDRLVVECERAKVRLSYAAETSIDLTQVTPAAPAASELFVNRQIVSRLTNQLLQRTFLICDDVLRKAGMRARGIDQVLMAGGTSLLPMVWEGLEAFFSQAPRCEFAPMEVVSIGASLSAGDASR